MSETNGPPATAARPYEDYRVGETGPTGATIREILSQSPFCLVFLDP